MLRRRLQRLAALTQGLALVGAGACNTDSTREPLHINAPYNPDAGAVAVDTTSDAAPVASYVNSLPLAPDAALPDDYKPPHTMNAPPRGPKTPPPPPAKP